MLNRQIRSLSVEEIEEVAASFKEDLQREEIASRFPAWHSRTGAAYSVIQEGVEHTGNGRKP